MTDTRTKHPIGRKSIDARDPREYPGVTEHLAAALEHAEDPDACYHIREEMQWRVIEATEGDEA